jgi:hypothetical protein
MAIHCFDRAGQLALKEHRDSQDLPAMLALSIAAVHHAEQVTPLNRPLLVAATWQASRAAYEGKDAAICGALAHLCEQYAQGLSTIYAGYAFEALARAANLIGRPEKSDYFAGLAEQCADDSTDHDAARGLRHELRWRGGVIEGHAKG